MAGKSLGTLTIDLIAQVGGFTKGMDQAERSSEKWRKQVESDVKAAGSAIKTMAGIAIGASTAIAGASIALLKTTSDQITETDRWAKSLGMSTQSLLQWQFAAKQAGLSGDNMADIFKDMNDKLGDAILNKSGEAAQAFDTLGLSAKKLQALSPDKQLLAIADAMKGMNVAQKTNILESLGNDLSKLLPLFDNNNEKLKLFLKQSTEYNVSPPQADIDKLVKVNAIFQDLDASWDGFKNTMASGLADIDLSSLVNSVHELEHTLTDPQVLQGIANMVTGFTKVVDLLAKGAKLANDMAYGWGKTGDTSQASDLDTLIKKRKELNESLKYSQSFLGTLDALGGNIRSPDEVKKSIALNELLIKTYHARKQAEDAINVTKSNGGVTDLKLGKGDSNQNKKPPKAPVDNAALKLENSFASTEQGYLKQIALIDTTGKKSVEVTEQQKLAFDLTAGKLSGLNDLQQKRLQSLASEVDHLNAVKKANEDNAKVAAYVATLKQSNDNNKQDLQSALSGAGMGDKARSRMKEIASMRQDFNNQQLELNKQYNEDGNKELYEKETKALSSALDERLSNLQDYYKQADEMESEWSAGISESLQNFVDDSQNYYQQAADATTSILGTAVSSIGDNLTDVITGTESLKDAFSNIMADIGRTVIDQLTQMAAQWLVYQGVQLLTSKATQASASSMTVANAQAMSALAQINAYASAAAVPYVGYLDAPLAAAQAAAITEPLVAVASASSLAGMAHDGLDSVPETGTWLLQKGERVTTAQTSSKLDKTLDRVSRDSNKSSPAITMHQNFNVNGDPSDAQIAMMKKAAADGAKQGYQQVVRDMSSGTGQVHKAMTGNYKAPRRIG
ncbi:phage tail tape measure protein [Rosenbergiella epipactidis]|uniref:phage tail tape measure protein n=1 Tax=Rosenbergiella epipactidis TaxID=1544694 RepID=UPI002026EA0D|nr:phage tail tape measure protein [Rosenbergiella epipactidis]MCL9669369.1 phage tail tape measure protein [Rosenbergiella epipactidis]